MRSDGSQFLPLIERLVTQKLRLAADAPRPAALRFLGNPEVAKASLDRYLRTTPEFLELEHAWQERKTKNPDESPLEPAEVLGELFQKAFFEISFDENTKLNIVLACGEPPTATNGIWDDNKRQVAWKTVQNGHQGLPTFMYAIWSVPIADAQIKTVWQARAYRREPLCLCNVVPRTFEQRNRRVGRIFGDASTG